MAAEQGENLVHFFMGLKSEQRKVIMKYSTNIMPESPIRGTVKTAFEALEKLQELPYKKIKAYFELKPDMELGDFLSLGFYASVENIKKAKREVKRKKSR